MKVSKVHFLLFLVLVFASFNPIYANKDNGDDSIVEEIESEVTDFEHEVHKEEKEFDAAETIMHHIADANEFHLFGNVSLPLPIILYDKTDGFKFFISSSFDHGHTAIDGFVMDHGSIKKILGNFPKGKHHVEVEHGSVVFEGNHYETEGKHSLIKSAGFYDFSITKNVFTVFLACAIMLLLFIGMSRFYKKGNQAPKGIYGLLEPIVLFVKEDIAVPNIGEEKADKYLPYLLTAFFFIWIINLLGLIPFFPGGANVTGNIAITLMLAVITMIITNFNGSKTYWGHIFNPPVPMALKPLMIPIEIVGILTKPFALMIRLFANITAGHILILSLLSLIFIFKSFALPFVSVPFVIFMTFLELLVAFLQAYIFTLLSALFIGLAVEEHRDHH
ncbi:MAG: F0F1 ATP synthase subunit A [Chitinophagales bacterium]|nr:F0F1 ATP synthase subunit A [Chitinophagales bacterium]